MTETRTLEAARLLCALWTRGTQVSIPFGDGHLDRALRAVERSLPTELAAALGFDEGPEGPRCSGLPAIERAGREAGLFGSHPMAPGCGVVAMPTTEAATVLAAAGMEEGAARRVGRSLFEEVLRTPSVPSVGPKEEGTPSFGF